MVSILWRCRRMPARRDARARLGVFLAYASRSGHALLDRELSLPAA